MDGTIRIQSKKVIRKGQESLEALYCLVMVGNIILVTR